MTVDLGEPADFSGTTLGTGNTYYVVTAEPGRTATMKFDGANIVTNTALIELIGANARLTDENGAQCSRSFPAQRIRRLLRSGSRAQLHH